MKVLGAVCVTLLSALLGACGRTTSSTNSVATPRATSPTTSSTTIPATTTSTPSAPPGAEFAVNGTSFVDGQSITTSGNDCPPPDGITTDFSISNEPSTTTASARHADGTWSLTSTVPAGVDGSFPMTAQCWNGGSELFTYPEMPAVSITSPYDISVSPSADVAPGTTISVVPVTSFCSNIDTVYLGLSNTPLLPGGSLWGQQWPVAFNAAAATAIGSANSGTFLQDVWWQATLTIPSHLAPGTYWVVAGCGHSRSTPGVYHPDAITVG